MCFRRPRIITSSWSVADFKAKKGLPLEKYYQLLLKSRSLHRACSSCCPARGISSWRAWEEVAVLQGYKREEQSHLRFGFGLLVSRSACIYWIVLVLFLLIVYFFYFEAEVFQGNPTSWFPDKNAQYKIHIIQQLQPAMVVAD